MFRFTIRDLLWLMVVAGLSIAFCLEGRTVTAVREHAWQLRRALKVARSRYEPKWAQLDKVPSWEKVDWTLVDEPIP